MVELLTVCTGNICRSPLAEIILRARLSDPSTTVHSAGTRALVGHEMTDEAIKVAEQYGASGADAGAHRARVLTEGLLSSPDLIIAMTREHRRHIVDLAPHRLRTAFTAREFERLARLASDDALRAAAAPGDTSRDRLRLAVEHVAGMRGRAEPPGDPSDDDVIDPYRQSWATYERSAAQLVPAIDEIARVVRIALG